MSVLLEKWAPIQQAMREFEKAEERLKAVVTECQSECPHNLVLTYKAHGDEMRLCPKCGLEEHVPIYHAFAFEELKAEGRLLMDSDSSMFQHRVQVSDIRRPLK